MMRRGVTVARAVSALPTPTTRTITTETRSWAVALNKSLAETDPDLQAILKREQTRQRDSCVLIASENFTSRAVMDALGSCMSNKYSEGYPGARYYGGNQFIDESERLCQKRALEAFGLDPALWGVNVQSLSGSPANFAVYTALLEAHDRILSLDLPHGGHLSHGYQTATRKVSAVSKFFETLPYRLDDTGVIDYKAMAYLAEIYRPKLIVAGASAYPRLIDYGRFREVADAHGSYLVADIAHVAGLMSAEAIPSAFKYCDVVTTTTHKSLRGPRGAMIFYRKGVRKSDPKTGDVQYDLEDRINAAVFPGLQGGPHNHTIMALAAALKQVNTPEFKAYSRQVVRNCSVFAQKLIGSGYTLSGGGTDNHLVLMNLRPQGIDGSRVEAVLELCNIAANKNTVVGDKSAMTPGGLRMGTPAMTTRGATEEDFAQIAEFVRRGVDIAQKIKTATAGKKLKEFKDAAADPSNADIAKLRKDVTEFSRQFPVVGFDAATLSQ